MVPSALTAFMAPSSVDNPDGGPGNQFFGCKLVEDPLETDEIIYDTCPVRTHLSSNARRIES